MKQTLTICLPLLLAAFYLGCKKEASDPLPATALGKAFVPPDETTGKLLIGSFLAALPQEGVASARASFSDTPVAEGRWLIEATGNYLWNHNMKNRVMHSVIESPLSINHAAPTAGGVAQLSGTDMTAKFDAWKLQLLSRLSANMVVGAIDIETESSSANKTNFKVKAAIMQTPSVPFH
jgi:hypothetical protein